MAKYEQTSKEYLHGKWQHVGFRRDKKGEMIVEPLKTKKKAVAEKMYEGGSSSKKSPFTYDRRGDSGRRRQTMAQRRKSDLKYYSKLDI